MEKILVIDESDNVIGVKEKIEVHKEGLLHRAFSAIVINDRNEILIQRRAKQKYHSGGLYSNSFCSHFYESETTLMAIRRAADNELGMDIKDFKKIGQFKYFTKVGKLFEHELDRVFLIPYHNQSITPNPEEVSDYVWKSVEECRSWIKEEPDNFTEWFKIIMDNPSIYEQMRYEA